MSFVRNTISRATAPATVTSKQKTVYRNSAARLPGQDNLADMLATLKLRVGGSRISSRKDLMDHGLHGAARQQGPGVRVELGSNGSLESNGADTESSTSDGEPSPQHLRAVDGSRGTTLYGDNHNATVVSKAGNIAWDKVAGNHVQHNIGPTALGSFTDRRNKVGGCGVDGDGTQLAAGVALCIGSFAMISFNSPNQSTWRQEEESERVSEFAQSSTD